MTRTRETVDVSHYGVKGMHWGVRRADVQEAGDLASKATALKSDKTKKVFAAEVKKAGGLHTVSDEHLKQMLERMNMEKRYNDFMKEESKRRAAGAKALGDLLLKIGKIAVPIIVAGAAAKTAGPTVFNTVSQFQKSIGR